MELVDKRNVIDYYKHVPTELIKQDLQTKSIPFAICASNIQGNLNLGMMVRTANAFNIRDIFYYGKRKYDKRSTVGTHVYEEIKYIESIENLSLLKNKYPFFIAIENNLKNTVGINEFIYPENSMVFFGEESGGISDEVLSLCDYFVEIPQQGSVRSLNVSISCGIVLYDIMRKQLK